MDSMRFLTIPLLALTLFQEGTAVRCYNDGVKGAKGEHHSCQCVMKCVPADPHGAGEGVSTRCATFCRQADCHCKPPCV